VGSGRGWTGGALTFGLAYRRGRRPAPTFARMLGAGVLTLPSGARVCWLADVGLESPTYLALRRARVLGAGLLTPPSGAT
jgi:hypothetical protein